MQKGTHFCVPYFIIAMKLNGMRGCISMNYKSRYDALKSLLFPKVSGGKTKGYESSMGNTCIQDWSPHNLRRLIISPRGFAVGYYRSPNTRYVVGLEKYNFCALSSNLSCDSACDSDIASIQSGDNIRSILEVLVDFKQFSMIEEIVFCGYTDSSRWLLQNDCNLAVLTKQSKVGGNFEEKLRNKYPRLSRIYYVDVNFEKIANFMLGSRGIKPLGRLLYDSLVSQGVTCRLLFNRGSDDWKRGRYTTPQIYKVDELLNLDITKYIEKLDELEKQRKEREIHEEAERSRGNIIKDAMPEGNQLSLTSKLFSLSFRNTEQQVVSCITLLNELWALRDDLTSLSQMKWGYVLLQFSEIVSTVEKLSGSSQKFCKEIPDNLSEGIDTSSIAYDRLSALVERFGLDLSRSGNEIIPELIFRVYRIISITLCYGVYIYLNRTNDHDMIMHRGRLLKLTHMTASSQDIKAIATLANVSIEQVKGIYSLVIIAVENPSSVYEDSLKDYTDSCRRIISAFARLNEGGL